MYTAPWTDDEVASLRHYQVAGVMHPFTSAETGEPLIPTRDGWVEREGGPVVQTWCHKAMADWSWESWIPEAFRRPRGVYR